MRAPDSDLASPSGDLDAPRRLANLWRLASGASEGWAPERDSVYQAYQREIGPSTVLALLEIAMAAREYTFDFQHGDLEVGSAGYRNLQAMRRSFEHLGVQVEEA